MSLQTILSKFTPKTATPTPAPNLDDEPSDKVDPEHLRLRKIHRNLTLDPDGVWAWYRLADIDWMFQTAGHRRLARSSQTHRWTELLGTRVRVYGTPVPFNHKGWARRHDVAHPDRVADEDGTYSFEDYLTATQKRMMQVGARTQATIVAVRVADEKAKLRPDDLPLLLSKESLDYNRAALEPHRRRVREVGAIMRGAGFDAKPLRDKGIGWAVHSALAPGAPVPGVVLTGEGGVEPERVAGFTGPVWATNAPYAPSTTVRAIRDNEEHTSEVITLHVDKFDPRDPEATPFFSWLAGLPYEVRFVAELDLIEGRELKAGAEYAVRLAKDLREHFADHDEEPDEEVARGLKHARFVRDQVSNGSRDEAGRARGPILLQVHGATAADVQDLARQLTSDAQEQQGITLAQDYGQWESYRSLVPGEPIRRTGHITRMPLYFLAAGVPNASAAAGDQTGLYVGPIHGSHEVMVHDPHGGASTLGGSNLEVFGGRQGCGKSTAMGERLEKSAWLGNRAVGFDPVQQWHKLGRLPWLRSNFRHVDTLTLRPGSLSPTLEPEPNRERFDTTDDWKAAKVRAEQRRVALLLDTFALMLPHGMIVHDKAGRVSRTLEASVAHVGGAYGTNPWEYIADLERRGETGRDIAEALRARSKWASGSLVFPVAGDLDDEYSRALMNQALLTIVSAKVQVPPSGDKNRANWSPQQYDSLAVLNLSARLAARVMEEDLGRKTIAFDELGIQVASGHSFGAFLNDASVSTRRSNTDLLLGFQSPNMLMRIDPEIPNLIGAAWIGGMGEEVAKGALPLLKLNPQVRGVERIIAGLKKGQWVVADWNERIRVVTQDRGAWHKELIEALDSNAEGEGQYRRDDTDYGDALDVERVGAVA